MNRSNPFQIEYQELSKSGEELSRVPFGKLIGNILSACVDAQENASQVAWDYTRTVLARKSPMVFTFQEKDKLKRLEVPLVTIVPLPYLRIDDVAIGFDANVEVTNTNTKQFMVQVNNQNSEDTTTQTAKATANMRVDIDAGTTDLPAGLSKLLQIMSGGIIVENVEKPKPALPTSSSSGSSGNRNLSDIIDNLELNENNLRPQIPPRPPRPLRPLSSASSSGHHDLNNVINNVEHNESNLKPLSSASSSGSHDLNNVINNVEHNESNLKPLSSASSSGRHDLNTVIGNVEDKYNTLKPQLPTSSSLTSASGEKNVNQVIESIVSKTEEEPVIPQSSEEPSVEFDAEHFSEEIDAKMKESAEKEHVKNKPSTGTITVSTSSQSVTATSSGGAGKITIPDRVAPSIEQNNGPAPLLALHVNWTKPSRVRYPNQPYKIEDFDILSTILSALLWRRFNGPIKLYTDNTGYAYYDSLGMLELWDGGVNTAVLETIPDNIPADIFWAGAKLFAIQNENVPFVMMDTDLMVWSDIRERLKGFDAMAYHTESLKETGCYIDYEFLKKPKGYTPNPGWDWTLDPYNTALTYYANIGFRNYYTSSAIRFMTGNTERPMELVSQMVFAEQRIFAMCAKYNSMKIGTFLSSPYEDSPDFTHIWGGKDEARNNPSANNRLCSTLARTIVGNFKDIAFSSKVKAILQKYTS